MVTLREEKLNRVMAARRFRKQFITQRADKVG